VEYFLYSCHFRIVQPASQSAASTPLLSAHFEQSDIADRAAVSSEELSSFPVPPRSPSLVSSSFSAANLDPLPSPTITHTATQNINQFNSAVHPTGTQSSTQSSSAVSTFAATTIIAATPAVTSDSLQPIRPFSGSSSAFPFWPTEVAAAPTATSNAVNQ